MEKPIDVFEHGRLLIGEQGFEKNHWEAYVKLNTLHNNEYFDVLHNGLRFKQYVGVIQVDGLLVNIHPKADKNDADDKWKPVLLQMLKTCGKLKAQSTGQAQLKHQHINLLEVYFEYYLNELEQLIRQGLVKKYRTEKSNVKALKGKLDFAGNLRHNFVHQERFYTSHQVYDRNHQLHQVLAYALQIVGQFSRTSFLNDKCKRIQLGFPEVDQIKPTIQLLDSLQIDRKTSAAQSPQLRLMQSQVMAGLGQNQDAIKTLQLLIQEFPELPEPYNNLGVLLAAQGQYESAAEAFLTAIQARPNYKVAFQNLGDLYTAMAQLAYAKAKTLANDRSMLPPPKPAASSTTTTNTRTLR